MVRHGGIARRPSAAGAYAGGYQHHCRVCDGTAKPRCFDRFHLAYCEECHEVFQTLTKAGCSFHPYRDGFNITARKVNCGVADPESRTETEMQQEAEHAQRREREAAAELAAEAARAEAMRLAAEAAEAKKKKKQKKGSNKYR